LQRYARLPSFVLYAIESGLRERSALCSAQRREVVPRRFDYAARLFGEIDRGCARARSPY
jgi:hypothetical protein